MHSKDEMSGKFLLFNYFYNFTSLLDKSNTFCKLRTEFLEIDAIRILIEHVVTLVQLQWDSVLRCNWKPHFLYVSPTQS